MRTGSPSRTAMMVAYWRALADLGVTSVPHFSDPAARKLLSGWFWTHALRRAERLNAAPRAERKRRVLEAIDWITLRVAFLDAELARIAPKQVVLLGAGLDTRSWRLEALRGARVFEVDFPATQDYKRERAPSLGEPLAKVTYVPVDFARDELGAALAAAGHDATQPTAWVWEGVIMYLDDAALRSTLRSVRSASAPGSTLLAHYHEPEEGERRKLLRKLVFRWLGEPQIGLRSRDAMRSELERAGFRVTQDADVAAQAARVGGQAPTQARAQISRIMVAEI